MTDKPETGIALLQKELPQLKAIMGLSRKGDTATMALQELDYLNTMMLTKPEIGNCLPISIVSAVKSVLKQNLSLDPAMGLVYVTTRKIKQGEVWKDILEIKPSANGLLSIARQAGRVLDMDRPKITRNAEGKVIGVSFRYLVPTITTEGKKGARWKEDEFDEYDFQRWRMASHKEKSRSYKVVPILTEEQLSKGWKQQPPMLVPDETTMNYANKLYTSWMGGIDPEFARAKAIRHSGLKKSGTNQNEVAAMNFSMAMTEPMINPEVEEQEEREVEFTTHEEIVNINVAEIKPEPSKITIKVPNPNDL